MEANEFVTKLKAEGTELEFCDLDAAVKKYKGILAKLTLKEKAPFSLNILCVICRNLEKVPSWSNKVDKAHLLTLCIYCVNETKTLNKGEQVKTLACIYHIHRFVVKQPSKVPPELVLKLSYQIFENEPKNLLKEYCKTYWNVLADRIAYIEKLKSSKTNINKLQQKLTEDIVKIISIYDPVEFCEKLLVFLIKKLFFLYNDCDRINLKSGLKNIFEALSKIDAKMFKKLEQNDALALYGKFNECVYLLADLSSKDDFKDPVTNIAVKTIVNLLGHDQEIFHCVQSFYLNGFGTIMNEKADLSLLDTALTGIIHSCEISEKLQYEKVLKNTYPYLNQLLRMYIDHLLKKISDSKLKLPVTSEIITSFLKAIVFFMKKLKNCAQISKCERCDVNTGLHDSLRISFTAKNLFNIALNIEQLNEPIMELFYDISKQQHTVLEGLCKLKCRNYETCFKKTQTDIHNIAILLNKSAKYDYSIKLFDLYLIKEIEKQKTDLERKNISRAFYNKSICELDFKLYENSLKSAYLSFIFAQPEGLKSEKHISLVIDIKAKVLKADLERDEDIIAVKQDGSEGKQNGVVKKQNGNDKDQDGAVKEINYVAEGDKKQLLTVLDIAKQLSESNEYGDMKKYLKKIKFSDLIKHEFAMYAQLWPSVVPVAGTWRAIMDLIDNPQPDWVQVENKDDLLCKLYEMILQTPGVVRTIHSPYFFTIVYNLVGKLQKCKIKTFKLKMIYASLLLLKAEYDLTNAAKKFNWKVEHPNIDPDQAILNRTLPQEHESLKSALEAVEIITQILPELKNGEPNNYLSYILNILEVFVPLLLYNLKTAHGLQLAFICCELADLLNNGHCYVKNASAILNYATTDNSKLKPIIDKATSYIKELLMEKGSMETPLVFLCDSAIYAEKCKSYENCATLLKTVEALMVEAMKNDPKINLDLAIGRLLTAQTRLCRLSNVTNMLTCVLGTQRHYLTASNSESQWTSRYYRSLQIKLNISVSSLTTVQLCRSLLLWRRASCKLNGLGVCSGDDNSILAITRVTVVQLPQRVSKPNCDKSAAGVALPTASALIQARIFATITCVHKVDDAQIKIDHRLKHILGIQPWNESQPYTISQETKKKPNSTSKDLETMLEVQRPKKLPTSPSILCNNVPVFKIPDFLTHSDNCDCYACQNPACLILTCQTVGLQASTYFRAKEFDVAADYFTGFLCCCEIVDRKLSTIDDLLREKGFIDILVDFSIEELRVWFKNVQVEVSIEFAFFYLSQNRYEKSDSMTIRIHEIIDEFSIDGYLKNEVQYLLSVSAYLRKNNPKTPSQIKEIEDALDSLKLSPQKTEILKTPESKVTKISKLTKKPVNPTIVPDDEVPNTKRRVIKLNLDDNSDEKPESSKKRPVRKPSRVPVPKTSKPTVETFTPKPKSKLKVYSSKD